MLLVEIGAEVFLPVWGVVCEGRGGDTSGDFLIYWRLKYVSYDFQIPVEKSRRLTQWSLLYPTPTPGFAAGYGGEFG